MIDIKQNSLNKRKLGIYIHIPFCVKKCNYCGFFSQECSNDINHKQYVDELIEDIKEYGREYSEAYLVDTVFIGGGTPSILTAGLIKIILEAIREAFNLEYDAEITMEANPNSLTEEKLENIRMAGVNRLSIGLQSFDNEMLKVLGRIHTAEDFIRTFKLAKNAGFENINLDLMFAIPGQTMEIWMDTLKKAVSLSPEHISFYSLQLEEGTPFFDWFQDGMMDEIPDALDREMYHRAINFLHDAGYNLYEISNCAKVGFECKHNLKYWSFDEYLGIGAGASSFMDGNRFAETRYYNGIDISDLEVMEDFHTNTDEDNWSEYTFTGLRKMDGIIYEDFEKRFGRKFWDVFDDRRNELEGFFEEGLLIDTENGLKLSEKGIDISNKIMVAFV